ncbi:uncharacterized protein [Montipora foliosa]|uniref:uncharacterized protein n=1 Tax=Montipora foliosa TaxID=591990 RepID=UPI0035F20D01
MKVMITLLFLAAAVVVHAEEEKESNMKFHPQAVLHYLEMEDENMAKQVRRIIKMDPIQPTKQSLFPTALPTGLPPKIQRCLRKAVVCHKEAGNDACEHLQCIKETGCCLHVAGLRLVHLPPSVLKCLPIIPCCMLASRTCEERLCCLVRFGECARRFQYREK